MWAQLENYVGLNFQATKAHLEHREDFLELGRSRQLQGIGPPARRNEARQHISIAQCLSRLEIMCFLSFAPTQGARAAAFEDA